MTPYRRALAGVDPAAPLGLRDGALLALAAAGLTPAEIVRLPACAVRYVSRLPNLADLLGVQWRLHGAPRARCRWHLVVLTRTEAARVLAYLAEAGTWATAAPLFPGPGGGPLSEARVRQILRHYEELDRRTA